MFDPIIIFPAFPNILSELSFLRNPLPIYISGFILNFNIFPPEFEPGILLSSAESKFLMTIYAPGGYITLYPISDNFDLNHSGRLEI